MVSIFTYPFLRFRIAVVSLSHVLKKMMIKVFIWSVLLYGSETWCLTKEDIRKLEAMEMWIWRKIESIAWTDHITNDEAVSYTHLTLPTKRIV